MTQRSLAILFVVVAAVARFLPHPPNVAPIIGMGLFCGAVLPKRWALIVPVLAIGAGDLFLGLKAVHLFGWVAVALSGLIGRFLRERRTPLRLAAGSLAGSTLFFLISNFGVWALGWYPPTLEGLTACFVAGIPFYRFGLVGDLAYTFLLFGCFELFLRWLARRSTVTVTASE